MVGGRELVKANKHRPTKTIPLVFILGRTILMDMKMIEKLALQSLDTIKQETQTQLVQEARIQLVQCIQELVKAEN